MANYVYGYQIEERGLKEVDWRDWDNEECLKKSAYVDKYLNPSVKAAHTGWDHIVYKIFENKMGGREEYILICPHKDCDNGARYVNVSATSIMGIAQSVWKNLD